MYIVIHQVAAIITVSVIRDVLSGHCTNPLSVDRFPIILTFTLTIIGHINAPSPVAEAGDVQEGAVIGELVALVAGVVHSVAHTTCAIVHVSVVNHG